MHKHSNQIRFNIIEQDGLDYEQAKQDYLKGIKGVNLQRKHGIGISQYTRLLDRFRDDGIPVPKYKQPVSSKSHYNPKNYGRVLGKGKPVFQVSKTIKGKKYTFGNYKTEALAQKRVKELRASNWEGLLQNETLL